VLCLQCPLELEAKVHDFSFDPELINDTLSAVGHPKPDSFSATSGIDLRLLNEKRAGDGGFIGVKGRSLSTPGRASRSGSGHTAGRTITAAEIPRGSV
jgi:hypothetical protein